MSIKLRCPRCKEFLKLPSQTAGSYTSCPKCSGRIWVPADAGASGSADGPPPAEPPAATGAPGASGGYSAVSSSDSSGAVPAPPPIVSHGAVVSQPPSAGPSPVTPEGGRVTYAPPSMTPGMLPSMTPSVAMPPLAAPPTATGSGAMPTHRPASHVVSAGQPAAPMPPASGDSRWSGTPGGHPRAAGPSAPQRPVGEIPSAAPSASKPQSAPTSQSASALVSSFLAQRNADQRRARAYNLAAAFLGTATRRSETAAAPAPARKVARFITAETAESRLQLADGKLPELHLREGGKAEKKAADAEDKSKTVNPLVMFAALSLSVVFSIILVMVDFNPPNRSTVRAQDAARAQIKRNYFGDQDLYTNLQTAKPLKPYQILLREAQQAHTRGDAKTERACYRKVLDMLRAERETFARGVTGSRENDKQLEEHISTLLND